MFRLLFFTLLLFLLVFGTFWLLTTNEALTVYWLGYRIDTSTSVIALGFIVTLLVGFIALQFLRWVLMAPYQLRQRRKAHAMEQGIHHITEGMVAIAEGDTKRARKHVAKIGKYLGESAPIAHMLAAESSKLSGQALQAKQHYTALLSHQPAEFMALKGLLLEARKEGDSRGIIELGEKARKLKPDMLWVLYMLYDAYKKSKLWDKADDAIQDLARAFHRQRSTLDEDSKFLRDLDFSRERGLILMLRAQQAEQEDKPQHALRLYQEAVAYLPDHAPLALQLVNTALKQGRFKLSRRTVEGMWQMNPHPDLVKAYGKIYAQETAERRLKKFSRLLAMHPEHPESHKAMAFAALAAGQTSKARNHLKAAMTAAESVSLYQLMMQIEQAENQDADMIHQWKTAMRYAPADPNWICKKCKHEDKDWHAHCSKCGTWDSYEWHAHAIHEADDTRHPSEKPLVLVHAVN